MPFDILRRCVTIKRGTKTSGYLQLYLAFIMSGLIHHIPAINQNVPGDTWYLYAFFWMQPLAITLEDLAITVGKRAGIQVSCESYRFCLKSVVLMLKMIGRTKALGVMWTLIWMTWSWRFNGKYYIDSLHFAHSSLPSLVVAILR